MLLRLTLLLFVACPLSLLSAAEKSSVRAAQSALKEAQFYTGEADGTIDEETETAIRQFQIREGLPVSGQLDEPTLQKLGVSDGGPQPASTPRLQARERVRDVRQTDRDFLEQIEEGKAPPADASPTPKPQRPRPAPPQETVSMTETEIHDFVRSFVAASQRETPERELSFYADRVNYFGEGTVSRDFIEKDQRSYYRRWPEREFKLVSDPQILRASADATAVRYRFRYLLRSLSESARGENEHVLRLARVGDGLKIVGIRERKVAD